MKHSGPSDSDLEDDDDTIDERPSADIIREDEEVLGDDYESDVDDEQQTQKTVASGFLGRWFNRGQSQQEYMRPVNMRQRPRRASRRHRERRQRGKPEEEAEMMYNMEEGGEASMSASQAESEVDMTEWKEMDMEKKTNKKRFGSTRCQRTLLHVVIIFFFMAMAYGAYRATIASTREEKAVQLMSNGTSLWAPTTLIISLDGFRADFLQRGLTPTLNAFIREGVSPLYMLPPFPSVTFVSHYSMSTGMYPEEHGIVGNTFWDPQLKEEFYYTHPESSMQPKWWGGEPFWVTAEKQGVKSAIHMWPGSEAHIAGIDLEFVDKFNENEKLSNKVKRIFGWLDLPGPESPDRISESPRPQLIVTYVPNVDTDGHLYGPNSTEIRQTIKDADEMLTSIFDGIKARNLTEIINVIVVSDHGMATTSVDRLIQLDDVVDVDKIEHNDGWPLYGLRPKNDEDIEPMYHQIKAKAEENPNFKVYLRDKDMPPEYHFSKNPRIAPLWIVPQTGWAIVKKDEFDIVQAKNEGLVYHPRGLHGYDYRVFIHLVTITSVFR
jgi:predicted AlkP superfamily pyrophosphatase or phosphodiesterase